MHAFCAIRTTITILRPKDGFGPREVAEYVESDPDFRKLFYPDLAELTELILPRFVQEGKKVYNYHNWVYWRPS